MILSLAPQTPALSRTCHACLFRTWSAWEVLVVLVFDLCVAMQPAIIGYSLSLGLKPVLEDHV